MRFQTQFFHAPADITGSGGYIYPGTGSKGVISSPQNIPYYQDRTQISHIPDFQRNYNLRDDLVSYIKEGRDNMAKLMLAYAKKNGAYVVTDVEHRWYLEHKPLQRIYLEAGAQGSVAGDYYKFQVKAATDGTSRHNDIKRIQTDDHLVLMCQFTSHDRTLKPQADKFTAGALTAPMPELLKVVSVNYDKGYFLAVRNVAGDNRTSAPTTPDPFTVGTSNGNILPETAFFLKMGNVLTEGSDDQKLFSFSNTWDYNFCQYLMRKWGATDIEKNIKKKGQTEATMVRNKRQALEAFMDELDWNYIFQTRDQGYDDKNKWWGKMGGLLEYIPKEHYLKVSKPTYGTDMGDFTIEKFNLLLENKFYYGSQNKVLLAGVNWHTAFSTMINKQTQAVSTILDQWGVRGRRFEASNGGIVDVVPSDTLSLNGMSDYAILFDPSCFKYGHLENMDIDVIENLNSENPHMETGEIFGVLTTKRENPDANWVFVLG